MENTYNPQDIKRGYRQLIFVSTLLMIFFAAEMIRVIYSGEVVSFLKAVFNSTGIICCGLLLKSSYKAKNFLVFYLLQALVIGLIVLAQFLSYLNPELLIISIRLVIYVCIYIIVLYFLIFSPSVKSYFKSTYRVGRKYNLLLISLMMLSFLNIFNCFFSIRWLVSDNQKIFNHFIERMEYPVNESSRRFISSNRQVSDTYYPVTESSLNFIKKYTDSGLPRYPMIPLYSNKDYSFNIVADKSYYTGKQRLLSVIIESGVITFKDFIPEYEITKKGEEYLLIIKDREFRSLYDLVRINYYTEEMEYQDYFNIDSGYQFNVSELYEEKLHYKKERGEAILPIKKIEFINFFQKRE